MRQFIPDGFRDEYGVWHEGSHRVEFDEALAAVEEVVGALLTGDLTPAEAKEALRV